jgi:Zn-dependent alcohol dehydrogenase
MIETTAIVLMQVAEPFEIAPILLDSELKDQDVLVEFHATGICHTDIGSRKRR